MLLRNSLEKNGNFLFRWRGIAPLIFIPWLAYSVAQGEPLENVLGESIGDLIEFIALTLVLGGLAIRAYIIGHAPRRTSGRNVHVQVADVLNTTGVYSQCRNPLYLANCMTYIGIAMFCQNILMAFVMGLALALYYERIIMAEEKFLEGKFGPIYIDWAADVPALIPKFRSWAVPETPFTILTILRQEYPGWLATALLLTAIELGQGLVEGEALNEDLMSWILAGVVIAGCLMLNILKRNTTLLTVGNR